MITGHTARILAVSYNNTGNLLVTASRDKTLKVCVPFGLVFTFQIWDVPSSTELLTLAGHTRFICILSISNVQVTYFLVPSRHLATLCYPGLETTQ